MYHSVLDLGGSVRAFPRASCAWVIMHRVVRAIPRCPGMFFCFPLLYIITFCE